MIEEHARHNGHANLPKGNASTASRRIAPNQAALTPVDDGVQALVVGVAVPTQHTPYTTGASQQGERCLMRH
jgi:hypothetical protein